MQQPLWLEGDSGDGGGGTAAGLAQRSLTDPSNRTLQFAPILVSLVVRSGSRVSDE